MEVLCTKSSSFSVQLLQVSVFIVVKLFFLFDSKMFLSSILRMIVRRIVPSGTHFYSGIRERRTGKQVAWCDPIGFYSS